MFERWKAEHYGLGELVPAGPIELPRSTKVRPTGAGGRESVEQAGHSLGTSVLVTPAVLPAAPTRACQPPPCVDHQQVAARPWQGI